MNSCWILLTASAFLTCFLFSAGEPVKFRYCHSEGETECKIANLVIDPCPEALTDEPCRLKRGKSGSLSFNFTPHWTPGANKLKTRAFWSTLLDLPFAGMDTDVCKYAKCPLVKEEQNFYNFTLELSKNYLAQRYDIKFKIWEEEVEGHECCLLLNLKLT